MSNPKAQIETLRDKLESGNRGGSDRDRDVLLEFSDEISLLRSQYGHYRHIKLLRHLTRISEHAAPDLADCLTDKSATKSAVRWIHDQYDPHESPETNRDYRVSLRVFGRRVTDTAGDRPPDPIDWIPSTTPNDYDPTPDPADMVEWDEIEDMIEETMNCRDAAAISMQFDGGFRGGELYDMRVGSVSDSDHGLQVVPDGKVGERDQAVNLIPSVPYVNRWLSDHPGGPDSYLWTKLNSDERLSYQYFLEMFKDAADRAGIDKPVTPTNLRKSNLRWLVRSGLNARLIEKRQGRKPGSEAVSRYFTAFDSDSSAEYARVMGKDVSESDVNPAEDAAPAVCPRCDKETPRDKKRCMWCGQSLAHDVTERDTQDRIELARALKDAEGETAENLQELIEFIERNPWLRDIARE